jgi:hypothetical protein
MDTVVRIWTGEADIVGPCDHCREHERTLSPPDQIVTLVTLHRHGDTVSTARFCERHFLLFSDLVNDQVASLLYPKVKR